MDKTTEQSPDAGQIPFQPPPIMGYRALTQVEIDLANEVKAMGERIEKLTDHVRDHLHGQMAAAQSIASDQEAPGPAREQARQELFRIAQASPQRWLQIGVTDLQKGLMFVTRAIAQPGPEQVREYRLADNATHDIAQWDAPTLEREMEALGALGVDLDYLGLVEEAADEGSVQVREVDTHEVEDSFWIAVRGPLKHQALALQTLSKLMDDLPGVQVELGTVDAL